MRESRLQKILIYMLIVVVAAAIIYLLDADRRSSEHQQAEIAALEAARRPYLAELAEISTALTALDWEESAAVQHTATLHILLTEPHEEVISLARPLMEKYGYTAIVAVSETHFPGDEGMMTVEQAKALVEAGGELCLSVTEQSDMSALHQRMVDAGLPAPLAAYFPDGDCNLAVEAVAQQLGICVIIQYGSTHPVDAQSGTLWYMEARGTFDSENYNAFTSAMLNHTGMVLTEGWVRSREKFSTEDLEGNLVFFQNYIRADRIRSTTLADAWQQYGGTQAAVAEKKAAWEAERLRLTTRMQEIEHALQMVTVPVSNQ